MKRSSLIVLCALASFACPAEKTPAPPAPPPPAAASQPASQAASKPAPKALDVKYDGTCLGTGPCTCKGRVELGRPALAEIGVDDAALTAGTPCVLGDFDGNGHPDGAFLGKGWGEAPAVDVAVLMFDRGGLASATKLPKKVGSLTAIYEGKSAKLVEPKARLHFVYADGVFTAERLSK